MYSHMYVYCRLAHLTGVFEYYAASVLYIIGSDQMDISNYICYILFISKGLTNFQN